MEIKIRNFCKNDLDDYIEFAMDKNNYLFMMAYAPKTVEEAIEKFNNYMLDSSLFAIVLGSKVVGYIKIDINSYHKKGTIGYMMSSKFQNKGYATSALGYIVKMAFEEKGLEKLEATCYYKNYPSIRVLEKNAFLKEGLIRKEWYIKGEYSDIYHFGLTKEDYYGS